MNEIKIREEMEKPNLTTIFAVKNANIGQLACYHAGINCIATCQIAGIGSIK